MHNFYGYIKDNYIRSRICVNLNERLSINLMLSQKEVAIQISYYYSTINTLHHKNYIVNDTNFLILLV